MHPKLLLIIDRAERVRLHTQLLIDSGMRVTVLNHTLAENQTSAPDLEDYDLILINLFDEESDSIEICRKLRAEYDNPLLVMLYERDERLLLRAYEAGADDCLVQPLNLHLLRAKVQAWLRRSGVRDEFIEYVEAYKFRFNPAKNAVITPQNISIQLTQFEARLLHVLMLNKGGIVEHDSILRRVWPDTGKSDGDRHLLKSLLHRLRRKLEADPTHPQYIHTIPHQGYSFRPE